MTVLIARFKNQREATFAAKLIKQYRKTSKVITGKNLEDLYLGEMIEEGLKVKGNISSEYFKKYFKRISDFELMNIIYHPSFKRDIDKVNHRDLLLALREKIQQIEVAPGQAHITGLKLLRGYSTHYRIQARGSSRYLPQAILHSIAHRSSAPGSSLSPSARTARPPRVHQSAGRCSAIPPVASL